MSSQLATRLRGRFAAAGDVRWRPREIPAAICRKVALARDGDEIEIWGDGKQRRSYCYIDGCIEGICRLMRCECREPLNLGQDRMITIDDLVDIVAAIPGKRLRKTYELSKPQGVRGRNNDNTRLRSVLGWEPRISFEEGLRRTYEWIDARLVEKHAPLVMPQARLMMHSGLLQSRSWGASLAVVIESLDRALIGCSVVSCGGLKKVKPGRCQLLYELV